VQFRADRIPPRVEWFQAVCFTAPLFRSPELGLDLKYDSRSSWQMFPGFHPEPLGFGDLVRFGPNGRPTHDERTPASAELDPIFPSRFNPVCNPVCMNAAWPFQPFGPAVDPRPGFGLA
jgi:hypothetical protein